MRAPTLPNFFLVGAHKAGTTAVARFLGQHPEVFMSPVKEPRYFALAGESRTFTGPGDPANSFDRHREEDYRELFGGVEAEKAVGEASTIYLYHRDAAENIRRRVPEARIIAILRQPVDRAYSNFLHCRRDGQESYEDFLDALKQEANRVESGWGPLWHYQRKGRYAAQLARYLRHFPREQILVAIYDELKRNPVGLLQRIYSFLGVEEGFVPDTARRWNPGGVPHSVTLQRVLKFPNPLRSTIGAFLPAGAKRTLKHLIQRANLRPAPKLPEDVRDALTRHLYTDEIAEMEAVTGLPVTDEWTSDRGAEKRIDAAVGEVPALYLDGART